MAMATGMVTAMGMGMGMGTATATGPEPVMATSTPTSMMAKATRKTRATRAECITWGQKIGHGSNVICPLRGSD